MTIRTDYRKLDSFKVSSFFGNDLILGSFLISFFPILLIFTFSNRELLFKDFRPDIYDKYATIVKTICRGDDLTVLNKMIESLEKVDKGKSTLKKESKKLGNELADQYLHPKLKKEKKDK